MKLLDAIRSVVAVSGADTVLIEMPAADALKMADMIEADTVLTGRAVPQGKVRGEVRKP